MAHPARRDSNLETFKDKVAIVTGGASGIGRALCEELAAGGAVVIAADKDVDGAERTAARAAIRGGSAVAMGLDVSISDQVGSLIDRVAREHGRLDLMFNNAGIGVGGEVRDLALDDWARIINVNLCGVVYGAVAAYRLMVRQGFGHIVNTASLAGLIPAPTFTPYAMTKHAVVGLSSSLRLEGAALGVRVSTVCPGFVQTGIYDASLIANARVQDIVARMPFKMIGADVAARAILRGVRRNQAFIVFPFYARLVWRLYRLSPRLVGPLARKALADFRAARIEPD
jgi:NAD(P)-dependent dehydrogenase (short-subunit alcohol dehydrogenase family)